MAQIQREGRVVFHDASIGIWEEGLGGSHQERAAWEKSFKQQVFKRIIQQLNRMGWKCEVPEEYIQQYSLSFARDHRYCRKGDLQGFLDMSGRHIKFEMWQDVANGENPNGGRYDFDKEQRMPYLLRIRMEWTRRRLRDYLCNVFSGYTFETKRNDPRNNKRGPNGLTANEWVQACYDDCWHNKGMTLTHCREVSPGNAMAADGSTIHHGQRVWFTDRKGRICTGIAYYNINNMWWVVTGKYDSTNMASFDLYPACPENPRLKLNYSLRRKRLEGELAKATKTMNFERAAVLRDLLFPKGAQLFMVYSKRNEAYHRPNWQGYTTDKVEAGKFTQAELRRYAEDSDSRVEAVA